MEKTLKKNDEVVVTIDRFADSGEGIAVYDGIVIFVPFSKPNDVVKIHIINDKKTYLVGKVIERILPENTTTTPPCPYFYRCGGCDIQHLSQNEQLTFKKEMVKNSLKKYAKIETEIKDVVESDKWLRYRNKFSFPVQEENGEIKIGMYRKNSHDIIDIEDCLLQSEKTQKLLKIFKNYMKNNKISAYNEKSHSGTVKHIVVREYGDEFILTIVVTDEKFNNFEPLIGELEKEFSSFGIVKNVNKLNNNVIFGKIDEHIYGLENLKMEDFGVKYEINNRSFLQVNDYIKNLVYKKIIDTIGGHDVVIDAYSGAGLLSSILAKNSEKVVGVEIEKEATKNADNLKNKNNLYNLTNINGDCSEIIPSLAKKLSGDFAIVVDPPRKGLSNEVIEAFLKAEPSQIVYLSCNPATLARDLVKLIEKYDIDFIQPYDMFPQTCNVETLVSLKLKIMQKTQNDSKIAAKTKKKSKKLSKNTKYFDFYDDIKSSCHKIVDW